MTTLRDQTTHLGGSLIQHGPDNDRVYLMKLDRDDMPELVGNVIELGRAKGYSKLFAKVGAREAPEFKERGFVHEACIPGMCRGEQTGYFMSKYLDGERAEARHARQMGLVLDLARAKAPNGQGPEPRDIDGIEPLGPDNAEELAALYDSVFESYPFPIHKPDYLRSAMADNVEFFGLRMGAKLVAAASSEKDEAWRCVEMTDFATLPETRGQGLASRLLAYMEVKMAADGFHTAYTIARAESPGMNIVFSSAGYEHGGTLTNNTQIGGRLESMNVWYKQIDPG